MPHRGEDYAAPRVIPALLNEEKVGPTSQTASQPGVVREHLNTLVAKGVKYLRSRFADRTDN